MGKVADSFSVTRTVFPTNTQNTDQQTFVVAQKMIEAYCDRKFPLSKITAQWTIADVDEPLKAVDDYPINEVVSLSRTRSNYVFQTYSYDEDLITPTPPSEIQVGDILTGVYIGGIPTQAYNAVQRQANVLKDRIDRAPELGQSKLSIVDYAYSTQYRSGLAPDIKQMVAPFRVIGF